MRTRSHDTEDLACDDVEIIDGNSRAVAQALTVLPVEIDTL